MMKSSRRLGCTVLQPMVPACAVKAHLSPTPTAAAKQIASTDPRRICSISLPLTCCKAFLQAGHGPGHSDCCKAWQWLLRCSCHWLLQSTSLPCCKAEYSLSSTPSINPPKDHPAHPPDKTFLTLDSPTPTPNPLPPASILPGPMITLGGFGPLQLPLYPKP